MALSTSNIAQGAVTSARVASGNNLPYGITPGVQGFNTPISYGPPAAAPTDYSAQTQALLRQIQASQSAYAPNLNLSTVYAQAGKSAAGAVNPYYTKQLKDFVAQQTADKINQQKQTQVNIQNLQDQLANTLQGNSITQARTGQDVLQNEQQINQTADRTQQDQGTQFDQARIAQAKQVASQGLTASGLGQGQVLQSQTDRNLQETRQAADVQQQTQAQELFKTRTFEDLARSGTLAQQSKTKGVTQANFDLNKYIQGQKFDLRNQKQTLENQRLSRLAQETQTRAKLAVNKFIQSISNPAQRQAAAQVYGGAF